MTDSIERFHVGLEPAPMKIRPDHELGAIAIKVDEADLQLLLSPRDALDLTAGLIRALMQLAWGGVP
jgi:hypothetical protein